MKAKKAISNRLVLLMFLMIPLFCLMLVPTALAQQTGGHGVPGGNTGGSGFPITLGSTSIASGSTNTALAGLTGLNDAHYLSCGSEIGAQINTVVTAMGAGGGTIVLPLCSNGSWTTTATLLYTTDTLVGYGPQASWFTCTVAGDCLLINTDGFSSSPTGHSAGGTVAGFDIEGNGATGQNLIHTEDMIGWTLHDISLSGATASGSACLWLQNINFWTERDVIYAVQANACNKSLRLSSNSSAMPGSFGYNHIQMAMNPSTGQFGVSGETNAMLYNGSLTLTVNKTGTSAKVMHFQDQFIAFGEFLALNAEENGSGGNLWDVTSASNSLVFEGYSNNGPPSVAAANNVVAGAVLEIQNPISVSQVSNASFVSTLTNNGTGSFGLGQDVLCPNINTGAPCTNFVGHDTTNGNAATMQFVYQGNNSASSLAGLATAGNSPAITWDINGNVAVPLSGLTIKNHLADASNMGLDIIGNSADGAAGVEIDETTQTSGKKWRFEVQTGGFNLYDATDNTVPIIIAGAGSGTFLNAFELTSASTLGWGSAAQFAGANDTAFSRAAANTVAVGNGTQGNTTGLLKAGAFISAGTRFSVTGCGTATSLVGGGTAGSFVGGSATCSPVITTGITAPSGYACFIQDETTSTAVFRQTAYNATTVTFTGSGTIGATDTLVFGCNPF